MLSPGSVLLAWGLPTEDADQGVKRGRCSPACYSWHTGQVREVDILQPDNQVVAHRLGYYWFRITQWQLLGSNKEDERLVDGFVYAWSYGQVTRRHRWMGEGDRQMEWEQGGNSERMG